jgi:predicted DNA-binding transcriptional regulator AlpA
MVKTTVDAPPPLSRRLLRLPALRQKFGNISARSIRRWILELGFPKPLKITRSIGMWDESQVDAWITRRDAQLSASPNANRVATGRN